MKNIYSFILTCLVSILLLNPGKAQMADFFINYGSDCEPSMVYLSNYSDAFGLQGNAYFIWDIDDTLYYAFEPPEMPFAAGNHMFTLYMYDDFDSSLVDMRMQSFFVRSAINDFFVSTGTEACPGEMVKVWVEADYWYLEWNFGDGSFITNNNYENYVEHYYKIPGAYNISLEIENDCGMDTIVKPILVTPNAKPTVEAFTHDGIYCPGDPVQFDTRTNYNSYFWNFGDGKTSTKKDPIHYFDITTDSSFKATLTATNICGQSNTDTVDVIFFSDQPANAYFDWWSETGYYDEGDNYIPCPNSPVYFNGQGTGTFEWDFGDGSVSNEKNPVNIYPIPGYYHVTLNLTNGCGYSEVHEEDILIEYSFEDMPTAEIYFAMPGLGDEQWMDTIHICPGELVKWNNGSSTRSGGILKYFWDFGDGSTSNVKNASHLYTLPGIYMVNMTVISNCGGDNMITKWVNVDGTIQPKPTLGVTPHIICDGERVFFYDQEGSFDQQNLVYNIDFGDGQSVAGLTGPTDSILYTLASHVYTGTAGTMFNYQFSVTNRCGNSQVKNGTIEITDDPAIKPFYYVGNSSVSDEEKPAEDWSIRRDPTDHEFVIAVQWPDWMPGMSDQFFIGFWYGGFDMDNTAPADGIVKFTSNTIIEGDSVKAYIPINPAEEPWIGIVAAWNCTGNPDLGQEPDVYDLPFDYLGEPITSFNLVPGGYTSIRSLAPMGIILPYWSGVCKDQQMGENYVYEAAANSFVHLKLYDDGTYEMYASDDPDGWNYLASISDGDYGLYPGDSIVFGDWSTERVGYYTYGLTDADITFNKLNDLLTERALYLDGNTYIKLADYGRLRNYAACPGDPVQFKIAGGISYEWHFGDGGTSNEQYPTHVYATPGNYEAFVVATNSCGRTDTIHTLAKVDANNIPTVNFWTDKWDVPRFEDITFYVEGASSEYTRFYTYEWNFGDGTSSTARQPVHAYERNGDYFVTLTISNSCGSKSVTQQVYIQDLALTCNAKFDFSVEGKTVDFTDLSWGEPTSWFWDFGDGTTSIEQNPTHGYMHDGYYFVCLSIFDEMTNCATQVCREVMAGFMNCRADFRLTSNAANNTVRFTDASTNATEWFWDFGDGNFSSIQNPAHTYSKPGFYPVYLAIFNQSSDCFGEIIKEVSVGVIDINVCFANFSFFVDETSKRVIFTDQSSQNITSWYWTFGDGTYTSKRNPEHTYFRTGIYPVCLFVFDEFSGCSGQICKEIPVGVSTCNMKADFSDFIDINTNAVTFKDKSTGNISNWFWNFGDGTTSSKKDPKHIYKQAGFYLVTQSVFDNTNKCSDHKAEFIQVGTVTCRSYYEYMIDASDNKVTFNNKSQGNIAEYFWYFDDGGYSVERNPVHYYDNPGMYFVELTVLDESGLCMDTYFEAIQVGELSCGANFNYFIDSATNVAYFRPDAIGEVTGYLWFFGDGSISTNPDPVHIFTQPGYYTIGLNTFDEATGCMDYYEETILIGREGKDCRADFMYMTDPSTFNVSFTDKSKGEIVDYIWEFGDRSLSFDKNPHHPYVTGGYYFVCHTVLNTFNIPNTVCKYVEVAPDQNRNCFAKFIYTVDSTTLSVRFIDKSLGKPDAWSWKFGDGENSTLQNPGHTYTEPGFYMVHLNTSNLSTTCKSSRYKLVNVGMGNLGLQADFAYEVDEDNLKADSYPVDFIGVTLGDGNKLKWDFGDGSVDSTSMQPTHEYTAPGDYLVCLTISNPVTGSEDTKCNTVTVGVVGTWSAEYLQTQLSNYPNPFKDITTVVFQLPSNTDVDLSIFDNAGRKVKTLARDYFEAGRYIIDYDGSSLNSGVYYLRLITDEKVITNMMIVR